MGDYDEITGVYEAKVLIVGDGAVGKTCLLNKVSEVSNPEVGVFEWNDDDDDYDPTTFNNWTLEWDVSKEDGGGVLETEVWDTAGQEGFETLRTLAYPGTKVYIVAYDATSMTSFNNVEGKWLPELEANIAADEEMWVVLTATKVCVG